MLSNIDLEELAKHYKLPLIAVTMKDELPNQLKNGNYIINLQSSSQGNGTHWTALKVINKQTIYFDSFGLWPSEEIKEFVKTRDNTKLAFTTKEIQNYKSENCGYFCLAFLLFLQNSKKNMYESANDFQNNFSNTTEDNDDILKSFFRNCKNPPVQIKRLLKEKTFR